MYQITQPSTSAHLRQSAPTSPPQGFMRGMTLVEIIISMVVFTLVILGAMTVLIFSLRTVEDSRSFTQASQILNHEMEAMRMRAWSDRQLTVDTAGNKRTLHGLSTLGNKQIAKGDTFLGATAKENLPVGSLPFTPFAVYGKKVADTDDTTLVATIAGSNKYDVGFINQPTSLKAQYRNALGTAQGFTCTRQVTLLNDGCGANYALVTLTVSWNDLRGQTHQRAMTSTMAENGLNSVIYDLAQVQ